MLGVPQDNRCEHRESNRRQRPPFIIAAASCSETRHNYPNSDEYTGYERRLGKVAGLLKIGVNLKRLRPGQRSSWPHAEEKEEDGAGSGVGGGGDPAGGDHAGDREERDIAEAEFAA